MLGIGGVISFKNAGLDKVIGQIGIENVILETDAPYLAPVPFRGKRNEPAYVAHTGRFIAQLKGLDELTVSSQILENFYSLFQKIERPRND